MDGQRFVAKKTKSCCLVVRGLADLPRRLPHRIFPDDLLASSSLLALAGVVVGFIIVHLGTMISSTTSSTVADFLIGASAVLGIGVALLLATWSSQPISGSAADGYAQALDFVVAGTGARTAAPSRVIVQEAALGLA